MTFIDDALKIQWIYQITFIGGSQYGFIKRLRLSQLLSMDLSNDFPITDKWKMEWNNGMEWNGMKWN